MDRCYDISEQVLFDILLYLPIMSLLRFKSVCKPWLSLIESSTFITHHLNYNKDKADNLIILKNHWNIGLNLVKKLFLLSGCQYEDYVYIDFDQLLWHPAKEIELAGSYNGIICLIRKGSLDTALWNPALKQLRPLPQPLLSSKNISFLPLSGYTTIGIDRKTNDCKVLKIFDLDTEDISSNQVEIYSLRDNSWRIIHKDITFPFMPIKHSGVISPCTNGKWFWISDGDSSPYLVSFDFTDEDFGTMSLPDCEHDPRDVFELDIYNDKIVYIRLSAVDYGDVDAFGFKLEIWMLHEYGVKESWNKMYNFSPLDGMISPIGLSKNGEFLISQKPDGSFGEEKKLYLHNLLTHEGKFLQFKPIQAIHYSPSLFSVKSANDV